MDRRLLRSGRRSVGGWIAGGAPVLLLTTTGRRSGRSHTTPLLFHRMDDGSLLLTAANGAADWDPDWLHNLVAHPNAGIEIDGVGYEVEAAVLTDSARRTVWDAAVRAFPGLEEVEATTRRSVPLVRLTFIVSSTDRPCPPMRRPEPSAARRTPSGAVHPR